MTIEKVSQIKFRNLLFTAINLGNHLGKKGETMHYLIFAFFGLIIFAIMPINIAAQTPSDILIKEIKYGKDKDALAFSAVIECKSLTGDDLLSFFPKDNNTFSICFAPRILKRSDDNSLGDNAGKNESIFATPKSFTIVGRMRKPQESEIAIALISRTDRSSKPFYQFKLEPPSTIPNNRLLLEAWAQAWVYHLFVNGDINQNNSFANYEADLLKHRYHIEVPDIRNNDAQFSRGDDNVDLYSVATGSLAIQESLQYRVQLSAGNSKLKKSIPIQSLVGPKIKSHPFTEMIGNKQSVGFEIDKLVPHDQYYAHFSTISAEIALTDLLDQWGSSLLQSLEVTARDRRVKERILGQLNLQLSSLTKLFGDYVIGDLAITGNDPFINDGSDITVIMNIKNGAIFNQAVIQQQQERQRTQPDALLTKINYQDKEITTFTTKDRSLSSYSITLGSYFVVANSLAAIQRVIDSSSGRIKSLNDAEDYRYMRTIFPGRANEEDGFIYLSDAFIRRVVGAEQKIARLRQLKCIVQLRSIENAALLYRIENPDASITLDKLIKEDWIDANRLQCESGGEFQLNSEGSVTCSVHGSLHYLKPLIEIPSVAATNEEAAGYKQFVDQYNQYWRTYFDPVGIRFQVKDRIEVETCILPLIENSIYDGLRETIGGESTSLKPIQQRSSIATLSVKINRKGDIAKSFLRGLVSNDLISQENQALVDLLGDEFSINFCDSSPLVSINSEMAGQFLVGSRGMFRGDSFFLGILLSAITLPIYVTVDINQPANADAALDRYLTAISFSSRYRSNRFMQATEYYTFESYKGIKIRAIVVDLFVVKLRLFTAIVDNRLVVATQRQTLTNLIDQNAQGTIAKREEKGNLLLELRPQAFDLMKQNTSIHWQEKMRETCFTNLPSTRLLLSRLGVTEDRLANESLKRFGFLPYCPSGGSYQFDKESGAVFCSVHGSLLSSQQPLESNGKEPFINFLESLERLSVVLRFTPEGLYTKVVIKRK